MGRSRPRRTVTAYTAPFQGRTGTIGLTIIAVVLMLTGAAGNALHVPGLTIAGAQTSPTPDSDYLIYADTLRPGWVDWSYNSTVDWDARRRSLRGQYAIAWTANQATAGLRFHSTAGFVTSGYGTLRFSMYARHDRVKVGVQTYYNGLTDTPMQPAWVLQGPPDQPKPQWYTFAVPLGLMGAANSTIGDIAIVNLSGVPIGPVYIDDVRIVPGDPGPNVSPTATPTATATGTPTPTPTPTQPPPTPSPTPTATPTPGPSDLFIYADSLAAGWADASYKIASVSYTNTSPVESGTNSIALVVNAAYGAWWAHLSSGTIDISGYDALVFSLMAAADGQPYYIYATDAADATMGKVHSSNYGGSPLASGWKQYTIPLSALVPAGTVLRGIAIQDASGQAVTRPALYIDNVRLRKRTGSTDMSLTGLHVSGNQIVNGAGNAIRLHGVNRSGMDYACVHGWGFSDPSGTNTQAVLDAMKGWKVNVVRVTLSEHCWLGINGCNPTYCGVPYRNELKRWVDLITGSGMAVILDMQSSGGGTVLADLVDVMPNADHSRDFWIGVANQFKAAPYNGTVLFDVINEPHPDNNHDTNTAWNCWKLGGTACPDTGGSGGPWVGMDTMVDTIRGTGATNIIMLGGVMYSSKLTQWLAKKPNDPTGNLVASWHQYPFNYSATTDYKAIWNSVVAPLMDQVPVITGEFGVADTNCATTFVQDLVDFLEPRNGHYLAWTWNQWGPACDKKSLVTSVTGGTPENNTWGPWFRAWMIGHFP